MSSIADLIAEQARKTGADPLTLMASAYVESGWNPNAVGDNGSSFGLFQNHVGGAGGPTLASAKQYLDPSRAIENGARRFVGGSGGAWAASVQRPADRAGYARKVDAIIAQLRAGKLTGGSAYLNAPVAGNGGNRMSQGAPESGNRAAALNLIFDNDPVISAAAQARQSVQPSPGVADPIQSPARGKIGGDYRWIQQMGEKLFGLRNDPSNAQLTGGKHTNGSEHYSGRAVDFGNARNSADQLAKWQAWAKAQGLDVLNEGDHIHVSLPGRGV